MTSKTIPLTGGEIKVEYSGGANAWLRNDGTAAVYASASAGISAGVDGVVSIPASGSAPVYGANGSVYLKGTGSVQLIGSDYSTNPFRNSAASGGSGADEQARAALRDHEANTDIHVTAEEKAAWDGKADKSDIPTKTSELTNNSGFITSPDGGVANGTQTLTLIGTADNCSFSSILDWANSTTNNSSACVISAYGIPVDTPTQNEALLTLVCDTAGARKCVEWQVYAGNQHRILRRCIYGTTWNGDWFNVADGGNAASVGAYTESAIAALEARIAALEGGS